MEAVVDAQQERSHVLSLQEPSSFDGQTQVFLGHRSARSLALSSQACIILGLGFGFSRLRVRDAGTGDDGGNNEGSIAADKEDTEEEKLDDEEDNFMEQR